MKNHTYLVPQVALSKLIVNLVSVGRCTGSDMLPRTSCTSCREVMTVPCGIGMWQLRYAISHEALSLDCSNSLIFLWVWFYACSYDRAVVNYASLIQPANIVRG